MGQEGDAVPGRGRSAASAVAGTCHSRQESEDGVCELKSRDPDPYFKASLSGCNQLNHRALDLGS